MIKIHENKTNLRKNTVLDAANAATAIFGPPPAAYLTYNISVTCSKAAVGRSGILRNYCFIKQSQKNVILERKYRYFTPLTWLAHN